MTRRAKPGPTLSGGHRLNAIEAELAKVTEEFRLAKLAAKKAKAHAKLVKKDMKRLRKAWAALQDEQEEVAAGAKQKKANAASASKDRTTPENGPEKPVEVQLQRRVARSPEIVRKPRRNKKRPPLEAAAVDITGPAEVAEPTVAAANEPQLHEKVSDTTASPEE